MLRRILRFNLWFRWLLLAAALVLTVRAPLLGASGYWWLAAAWKNLLPSCPPCNQRRRQVEFAAEMTLEEMEDMFDTQRKDRNDVVQNSAR